MQAASGNRDIAGALADEAFRAQASDHSRALIALAILGEMRSTHAQEHLVRFAWQPLPTTGTEVEGDLIERTQLAMLQAKAVNGLAYLRSTGGDAEVLRAVSDHPSVVVRAEAISSYLWNHGGSPAARAELLGRVRPGEEVLLDRIRREPGESAQSFDPKVASFLKLHPELVPPPPVRMAGSNPKKPPRAVDPGPPPSP